MKCHEKRFSHRGMIILGIPPACRQAGMAVEKKIIII
jgi:hypothetical protein